MKSNKNNFILFTVILFGALGGISYVYADELSFDQQLPLVPDHGVRIIFESSESLGNINATVTSFNSIGNQIDGPKNFTLYTEDNFFHRSDYIELKKSGEIPSYELKVALGGTIDVRVNEITYPDYTIILEDSVNLRQSTYLELGKYNIGSIVDCSESFYGGDTDGDGICDNWENQDLFSSEEKGLNISLLGTTETYYYPCDPNASSDPTSPNYDPLGNTTCPSNNKPDLYFEIDWMDGHAPNQDSLAEIAQAFSNSPYWIYGGDAISGTIGYYKFENNLLDSSGNGNDGTINSGGNEDYLIGIDGQDFHFDNNSYITLDNPSNFDFDIDNKFSIAFWMKKGASSGNDVIISKKQTVWGKLPGWELYTTNSNKIFFRMSDGANVSQERLETVVADDTWHHIVAVWSGGTNTDAMTFYVDGALGTSAPTSSGTLSGITNTHPVIIGATTNGNYDNSGQLDSVQIYGFDLTGDQVNDLYKKEGIELHFQLSDGHLPHDDDPPSPGSGRNPGTDQLKLVWFGTEDERQTYDPPAQPTTSDFWDADTRSEKAQVFHYVIFGHDRGGAIGSSGYSEYPGNDIFMTLGSWDYSVGTQDHQSGSLMHEMGHNLNLHHGGMDYMNCKPNYISVMSYSRQTSDYIPGRPLDFSNYTLGTLTEPGPSTIGSYGGNELITAHGDPLGTLIPIMTGPDSEILGDFNKITIAGCSGSGDDLESLTDWDKDTLSLTMRENANWVDGINIITSSITGEHKTPNPETCVNLPERANPNVRSNVRTCVDETFTDKNVHIIRTSFSSAASDDIMEFIPAGSDPQPGDPEYCLDQARKTLEEIKNNPDISPAETKKLLEELMNKFDNVGEDDCDIPDEDKKRIFNNLLETYERFAAVVPEFETLAIIILSVSIMSVIILTSRTKLNLSQLNK